MKRPKLKPNLNKSNKQSHKSNLNLKKEVNQLKRKSSLMKYGKYTLNVISVSVKSSLANHILIQSLFTKN